MLKLEANPLTVAQRYLDAWNRRDPQGIIDAFAPGGSYEDPFTPKPLMGEAIGEYAGGLFAMVPDVSFEIVSIESTSPTSIVAQWVMKGINSGPLPSGPPSGLSISVPGCDVIDVSEDGVVKVRGYYDQKVMFEQLGYTVEMLPPSNDTTRFGNAMHVNSGSSAVPGAFGLTVAVVRDRVDGREVGARTEKIANDMMSMKGFLSFLGVSMADRMFTITAWESVEDLDQLSRNPIHRESVRSVYQNDVAAGALLSVWEPVRIKQISRCPECGVMYQSGPQVTECSAGHPASPPAPVF